MQVAATGAGSPSPPEMFVRTFPEHTRAPLPGLTQDGVSHSLQGLATPQINDLLGRLEHTRNSHDPQLFEGLLRTAVTAVGSHNIHDALTAIAEMVKLHPEHAAQLVHNAPGLAPIHAEVNHLFERLTMAARTDAVQILAAAAAVAPARDTAAANIIEAGERFLESGTLINYVRAGELGQVVLTSYSQKPNTRHSMSLRWLASLHTLWRRVPVLVLLVLWLLIGLIGGLISLASRTAGAGPLSTNSVEIWVAGFLLLVGFQFVVTVKNIRFK